MTSLHSLDFLRRLAGPLVATDLDGIILYWSSGAQELLGFAPEEMRHQCWWDSFPAPVREQIKPVFSKVTPSTAFTGTCALKNKQGEPVAVSLHISPLLDDGKNPIALLTLCHPGQPGASGTSPGAAAESQEAIYEARRAQAIGALAAGLAHDFNNILTAVLSHLELLSLAPEMTPELLHHVGRARSSAGRAAELVSRLLTFSRQTRPNLAPLELPSLFDEALVTLRRSIDSNIEILPPPRVPDLWPVHGDARQLLQVISNLCLNARDAMAKGGTLSFGLANVTFEAADARPPRRAGDFVRFTVSDTGKGVSPQVLARISEPNFTTKDFGKGIGLGLSIANSIVTEHGGWLEVESEIGKGNQFHAFLPRLRDAAPARQAPRELFTANNPSLEGKETILLVDDEEMVRLVARAILSYRGYTVVDAADGEEAIRRFSEAPGRYDLVLLDVRMPSLNGWETMARLREIRPSVKVILLSGGVPDEIAEQSDRGGAAALLAKPFDNIDLLRQVRRVLDTPAARR